MCKGRLGMRTQVLACAWVSENLMLGREVCFLDGYELNGGSSTDRLHEKNWGSDVVDSIMYNCRLEI